MKKILVLFSLLTFSSASYSGVLLEPYYGTIFNGELEDNDCTNGDCTEGIKGSAMGARVAYKMLGLFAGVDYRTSTYELEDSGDLKNGGRMALLVGYEMPILLRFWMSYGLSNDYTLKSKTSGNELEYEVKSDITLGVGYSVIPFLSLNLEIASTKFEKANNKTWNTKSSIDVDTRALIFSVSSPISF